MTRAACGTALKDDGRIGSDDVQDVCPAISDHLRRHVHLTNYIHLRNHMHRHSPVMAERFLMRDLIDLRRSRSLRDPSTSPPSWFSPSVVSTLAKKSGRDGLANGARKSLLVEQRMEIGRPSKSSPQAASVATSKATAAKPGSDRNSVSGTKDGERITGKESGRNNGTANVSPGSNGHSKDLISMKVEAKDKKISHKSSRTHNGCVKTLSKQREEVPRRTDRQSWKSSQICRHFNHTAQEKTSEKPKQNGHSQCNGFTRMKKRRFRSARRTRGSTQSRVVGAHNDPSIASNSLEHGLVHQRHPIREGQDEDSRLDIIEAPRNVCGIPWNWSRIHYRGKTLLDIAGRSLSCGLSDTRLRKTEGAIPQNQGGNSDMPIASDHIVSSTNSESEELPLLIEPPGSQQSADCPSEQGYSGELGILANHRMRHERDSDLASEARWSNHHIYTGSSHGRHRSLTQKYMPKSFKDIIGQNLVVQALSNAVLRRKVGSTYVFYGPHGTGKTSCARVFAKALNCLSVEQPKPCDVCKSCISHNLGNTQNVLEVGPAGNFDFEGIVDVLDDMVLYAVSPQYRVFIIDGYDTLSTSCWSAILRVIDRAPRHTVFVFISTKLDCLPHTMLSRCQNFFFPKLKESDIIYAVQWIATSEGLEIDKDALKLIASRSDGSLRDAEMTLDQLSLLGQKISLPLVQELIGLVSDEKLVDLLDLALSADTVNTVKSLREIMEAGAEPLALMSQLATIITDILAGSCVFTQGRAQRKFFRQQILSKEAREKLRQALKILSEAEKQLRMSNDKATWLTATMLQLAPDDQYVLLSAGDTSLYHSPLLLNNISEGDITNGMPLSEPGLSRGNGHKNFSILSARDAMHGDDKMGNKYVGRKRNFGQNPQALIQSTEVTRASEGYACSKNQKDNEKIWQAMLDNIHPDALKQFLSQEGKLISVSLGVAPTVQLMFSSPVSKSKAERFRGEILDAFESVLHSAVIIEIRCELKNNVIPYIHASANESSKTAVKDKSVTNQRRLGSGPEGCIRKLHKKGAIGGLISSPEGNEHIDLTDNILEVNEEGSVAVLLAEASSSHQQTTLIPLPEQKEGRQQSQRQSLMRNKVSLAHVIQKAEGCRQHDGWSRQKPVSIAEKLEQENLRLEPRSRSSCCWKVSRITQTKLPHLKIRSQKPHSLLKFVTCGRCLSTRSHR